MPRKPRRSISPSVSIARLSRVMPRTAHCATYPTVMQALSAAIRCSCGLAYWFERRGRTVRRCRSRAARHLIAAHAEALDFRTAARLALPRRDDMPLGLALRGIPLDPLNQGKQVVDIDAVDGIRRNGHCVTIHDESPFICSIIETASDRLGATWRALPEYAGPSFP